MRATVYDAAALCKRFVHFQRCAAVCWLCSVDFAAGRSQTAGQEPSGRVQVPRDCPFAVLSLVYEDRRSII